MRTSSITIAVVSCTMCATAYAQECGFDQTIAIPAGRERVTFSLWRYPLAAGDGSDFQYIMVRGADGAWHTVLSGRDDDGAWLHTELDLSGYDGQTITIRIGAFNDGSDGIASLAAEWNFASLNVFISSRIQ